MASSTLYSQTNPAYTKMLSKAIQQGDSDQALKVLELGADPADLHVVALMSLKKHDASFIKKFIDSYSNINHSPDVMLQLCSSSRDTSICSYAIQKGLDVSIDYKKGPNIYQSIQHTGRITDYIDNYDAMARMLARNGAKITAGRKVPSLTLHQLPVDVLEMLWDNDLEEAFYHSEGWVRGGKRDEKVDSDATVASTSLRKFPQEQLIKDRFKDYIVFVASKGFDFFPGWYASSVRPEGFWQPPIFNETLALYDKDIWRLVLSNTAKDKKYGSSTILDGIVSKYPDLTDFQMLAIEMGYE